MFYIITLFESSDHYHAIKIWTFNDCLVKASLAVSDFDLLGARTANVANYKLDTPGCSTDGWLDKGSCTLKAAKLWLYSALVNSCNYYNALGLVPEQS